MISLSRPVAALLLMALQLMLSVWGPCLSTAERTTRGSAAATASASMGDHEHRHGETAPADDGAERSHHGESSCAAMGACGPTGIHERAVTHAGQRLDRVMVSTSDVRGPALMPPSPEPPPPRG